ncbi:flagellar protein FlaG [uncultured Halopseudomonas sp.]|uniref:flagellar protein FlaG n=1 Tax=uncultured Halopseudomonas sp. TaxID=2901193 RepID=UPI0030EBBCD9|tara:strand:+ start:36435 stop:36839 length:405 start_codon:yes stop_codon:yes gene_type:complete
MEMGVLKPFEITSSARTGVSVEAAKASVISGGQKDVAAENVSGRSAEAQSRNTAETNAEPDRETLEAAVSDMQNFVQSVQRDINFNVDDSSGRVVINVTEATSGDVIRQIPSEEALRLSENLSEIRSLLFKAEA